MKISFSKRLIASYLFVVLVTLSCSAAYLSPRIKATYLQHLEQSLATQGRLLAQNVPTGIEKLLQWARLEAETTGCRITVIAPDGSVRADSEKTLEEAQQMDNHADRPEVQAALKQGIGESTRHSSTLHKDMLYLALPLPQKAGVLRLALPLTDVHRRIATFQKDLMKAGAAALLVALLVAWVTMRKISEPLRGVLAQIGPKNPDDLGHFAKTYVDMAKDIEDKVRDLTHEKKQQAAILSALVECILAVDQQGKILFINPTAKDFFALATQNVTGRSYVEILRHRPLTELLKEALDSNQPIQRELTLHTPFERIVSAQAVPVDYGSQKTGVLVALHDITELRRLEGVRREFVANVSHELRTPLTSIKGYTETLLDGALEDPTHNREFVQTIQDHANQLSRLIEDVLDLSAIEAQRVTYTMTPVSAHDIIERIIKALTPQASAKKIKISHSLSSVLPPVLADKVKLAQVFMNLLENAIKFNKEGGKVTISAKAESDHLTVTIEDTGRGITQDDLPRVFERFYRSNKDRSHDVPGTGLGLAIVKHLVEAHHGTVKAESIYGKGSTFQVTLPLATRKAAH